MIYYLVLSLTFTLGSAFERSFKQECIEFPTIRHEGFPEFPEEVSFDPNVHLDLNFPQKITDLNFTDQLYPSKKDYDLAFAAPARVLSQAGVSELLKVINSHQDYVKSTERMAATLRGISYLSKFVRDLIYDPSFLDFVSQVANEQLCPHSFGMHMAQVNFGKVEHSHREVDKWHFDSVDYVMVIILSDLEDMVGGELEVLKLNLGGRENTEKLRETGIPREHVETVSYQHSGYGIFAQGSKIMHRVTPVLEAKEDRISFIISFTRTDAFGQDNTRTVKWTKDPEEMVAWEFAKHNAWKASGQLQHLIEESDPNTWSPEDFASSLRETAAKLERAAGIILGTDDDDVGYLGKPQEQLQQQDQSQPQTCDEL